MIAPKNAAASLSVCLRFISHACQIAEALKSVLLHFWTIWAEVRFVKQNKATVTKLT